MKTIVLSDEDAAQVKAIMLTHAEMTDQQSIRTEEQHGDWSKLRHTSAEELEDLKEQIEEFNEDTNNLKRIAELF